MTRSIQAVLGAAALAAVTGAARANLIINGSFEQDPSSFVANGVYQDYGAWIRLAPGTTFLTGWTVAGFGSGATPGVDWHLGVSPFAPRPARDGLRMIDLNIDGTGGQGSGQGTISQTFATEIGGFYSLSFWLAGPSSGAQGGTLDPRSVNVDITGTPTQTFSVTASDPTNQVWYQQTLTFQASAASTTLTFSPLEGTSTEGFWGPFIDDVSVQVIPGPGGMALLALTALRAASRRR
jgi:choice-of-anchor C domain-containing protein